MRYSILFATFLAFTLASSHSAAQFVRDHSGDETLRSFHTADGVSKITRSFQSSREARQQLDRILFAIGLNTIGDRILLRASAFTGGAEAGINSKTGERFIFYNERFMQDLNKQTGEYWSLLFVLAHELGHHLAFHTEVQGRWHEFELEADRFAGFILRRMGATLEQTEAAVIAVVPEQASQTHPGRADRLQALTIGWVDGGSQGALQPGTSPGNQAAVENAEQPPAAQPQPSCDGVEISLGTGGTACYKPGSGESFKDCADCPEMVVVPADSFMMGSPDNEEGRGGDEGPRREVTIAQPFAVGKFEVTFAEWDACVSDGGCKYKPRDEGWGRGDSPVINVSWDDITNEYLPWLSRKTGKTYRLLTEAEWEYAARAGTTGPFSFLGPITTGKANYDGRYSYSGSPTGAYRQKTVPVHSFAPNPWGLYDVHGNVWELVQDCYADSYKDAPTDGSASQETSGCARVLRGGSWLIYPQFLRSASRSSRTPGSRYFSIGFRVARTLTP